MEFLTTSLELKFAADRGVVSGYGSVFGVTDLGRDRIEPGAFAKSIKERPTVPMMLEHREAVGVWTSMVEDRRGLAVRGKLSDTTSGRDARTLAVDGAITGLSIGYIATKYSYAEKNVRLLHEVSVYEVSLTAIPMNEHARIQSAKSLLARGEIPDSSTLELLLHAAGFSRRQVKRFMERGRAGLGPEHAAADLLDRMTQRLMR